MLDEIVNADTFHVFHHQKRHAVGSSAAVEQSGDVRMFERGEDLPFTAKAALQRFVAGLALDNLDCNEFAELLLELWV